MKKRKNLHITLSLLFCIFYLTSYSSCKKNPETTLNADKFDTIRTYTNPVGNITGIGDPFVLNYGGKYFMYATSLVDYGYKVWESDNMIDWKLSGVALDRNNPKNQWGTGCFYAPEVIYYQQKFYMVYSAISETGAMKIRIAVSDDPRGPFVNWSMPFLGSDSFSYIDGDIFIDGDELYMYFVKIDVPNSQTGGKNFQMMAVQLSNDLKSFAGTPVVAFQPSQSWEGTLVNEGPCAIKNGNTYYLMYSANPFDSPNYAVGYATASNPLGPWTKYDQNPILKKNEALRVSGPGHNSVTTSPDGKEKFIVYHTHTFYDAPGGDRNMCIDRLYFENGLLKINGPTRTPQPLPGGEIFRLIPKY